MSTLERGTIPYDLRGLDVTLCGVGVSSGGTGRGVGLKTTSKNPVEVDRPQGGERRRSRVGTS